MSLNNEFDPIGGDGVPASPDAVPQEASPRIIITAQPIQWEAHRSGQQWTEGRYGYCITLESEDLPETPYVATLGEGDPETFATLAEAQAWCQRDIDATVARWAVVAAPPPQAAPKAEAVEAAAVALLNDWAEASGTHFVSRSHGQCTTDTVSRADLLQLVRAALAAPAERVALKPLTDEQIAALTIMLDHFAGDPRTACLRPLVGGIGGTEGGASA